MKMFQALQDEGKKKFKVLKNLQFKEGQWLPKTYDSKSYRWSVHLKESFSNRGNIFCLQSNEF